MGRFGVRWGCIAFATVGVLLISMDVTGRDAYRASGSCRDFPSYDDIVETLSLYARHNPAFVRYFSIGKSENGRDIPALRISHRPDEEAVEPEIRIIGAIHGNECLAASMVMEIIAWMVEEYGEDDFVSRLVDSTEILLIPLVNPDGYAAEPAQRYNANGVDLNRNLGFGWSAEEGQPFSEPETIALRNASQANTFNLGLSYHTRSNYVNAPWNYHPFHPRDPELFEAIGSAYAEGTAYKVEFGWDWYMIAGDVNDWSLGTVGTLDWTVELLSDTDLMWHFHKWSVMSFLSWAFQGVKGLVTDRHSGRPLSARIEVTPEGEPSFSDGDIGDFHRILRPGTYDIIVWANGYAPYRISDVTVPIEGTIEVEVPMDRAADQFFAFAVNRMTMGQPISNAWYQENGYANTTIVSDCLGPPDGMYYSLGVEGEITLDMGADTCVLDGPGLDLIAVSGTGSDDPAIMLVAEHQDGPFVKIAEGTGDLEGDLMGIGFSSIRYVRIVDRGDTPFGSVDGGYDLDAVENLSPRLPYSLDTDSASDIHWLDTETETENVPVEDLRDSATAISGCGCLMSRIRPGVSITGLLLM